MSKKAKLAVLSFVMLVPFSIDGLLKNAIIVNASNPETIEDDLDDLSKTSDAYTVINQSSDVGFGSDSRYMSSYAATEAPTAATMWDNYGYLQYTINAHNLLTIVADESTTCGAPLVYAHSAGVLECVKDETETSSNWTRKTYYYVIPDQTDWLRILPVAYNAADDSIANWSQQITKVIIEYSNNLPGQEVNDELDDLSKTSDAYSVINQSSDVGFGSDSRYMSSYAATEAPTAATMWDNYGYLQYTINAHNLLTIVADESTTCGAPLVYAHSAGVLECVKDETETSSNWTRKTYYYVIPDQTDWLRILPVAYNAADDSIANWSQQITKVNLKRVASSELPKKEEPLPPSETAVVDELDNFDKTQDHYQLYAQTIDVGFGADTRYVTSLSPDVPADETNWWDSKYAYIQYDVTGKNIVKVCVDTDASVLNILPHIVLVANYGGADNRFTPVHNYEVTNSSNWCRVTYTFVLEENVQWARIVYSIYSSYDGRVAIWMQQVTSVTLDTVETLPEKGTVPTIEIIKKPDFSDVTPIDDACDELEGNTHFNDFYRVKASDGKFICFAEGTQEHTDTTWWEGTNGYVQLALDGQNLLTIDVLVEEKAANYINPISVFAGQGNTLKKVAINNVIKNEIENGYVHYTYVYILNSEATARLIFSSYNSPDGLISAASQQITHIRVEYVEESNLPAADPVDTTHDEAKNEMDAFVATFTKENYSATNWDYIIYYANRAKHDFMTSNDDDAILAQAKENINAVKTLAEEARDAKEKEITDFNSYFNNLDQTKYSSDNWAKIAKLFNDALTELEPIDDLNQIKQIIADTKEDIAAIEMIDDNNNTSSSEQPSEQPSETPSEQPSNSNGEKPSKKGCKGSLSTGMISFTLTAFACLILKKKKR